MGKTDYYRQAMPEVADELKVDTNHGLEPNEIASRLSHYGRNELAAGKKINPFKLFISQFNDVLIMVLLVAAGVSFGLSFVEEHGSATESLLIVSIVIAIAVVGFLNEYKAEKTVEALRKLVGHKAKVRRSGQVVEIPSEELVPGDVVLLEEGVKVPADIRLFQVRNLKANEASLTGESVPVDKNTFAVNGAAALGDQKNMVFSGTIIASGTAEGIAVGTGQSTEIGRIAGLVSEVEDELTPMQKKLDGLGRRIGAIVLAISILVFVVIFWLDRDLMDAGLLQRLVLAFTAAVALAVAAIPEGLAFVVRISLAFGARRMAARHALVRKLSAVEALGSTDVICSDKTGTLTRGEMTVRAIWFDRRTFGVDGSGYETAGRFSQNSQTVDAKSLVPVLRLGALNNNAQLKDGGVMGDPTEGSLIVSAAKAGLVQAEQNSKYPRVDEIPFSSSRKMMTTIHKTKRGYLVAVKGAPDVLLKNCSKIYLGGKIRQLTRTHKEEILAANSDMAKQALRILGFAYKEQTAKPSGASAESKLVFVGLQGMMDPPRTEVKNVMHRVHAEAGMRVIMITGDYIDTAQAVAEEIGINGEAISGVELDELSQAEFEKRVEKIAVYARVNPEHKIRIVQALKKHGHQVAMTGDGVNDAPAIKAADIGIAMGITGTDATKEAADLILLDDQFLTIINAIEEGRGIFDNVRKFVNYLLSANIAEVLTILGGVVLLGHLALTAAQLLFINIVTDGLPAIALGSDPAEKGIMSFKPHRFQEAIITRRVWAEMLIFGGLMSIVLLAHFWWIGGHQHELPRGTAVAFTAMVVYEMVRLIGIRSDYKIRWWSNPWLSAAILASFALQILVLYFSPLSEIFQVAPIRGIDWAIIGLGSLFLLVVMKLISPLLDRLFTETSPQYEANHYERA